MNNNNEFYQTLRALGPLRFALLSAVALSFILRPELGVKLSYEGWHVVTDLLVPVITPILFMLLLLDAIMAMVYRSDKSVEVKARYLRIVFINLILALALLFYWLPFYQQL
ncbi:MAG: hypothetical protein PVG75_05110 [Thioalkalispiraceae bacterium]|jgi:hypothetical protein